MKNGIARRLYAPTNYGERVFKAQEIALKYLNMGGLVIQITNFTLCLLFYLI